MIVGTNLVRLSQLEGIKCAIYRTVILHKILDQIVTCHDPLVHISWMLNELAKAIPIPTIHNIGIDEQPIPPPHPINLSLSKM